METDCRGQLEILVNGRQGTSRQITFIDAASVLDMISVVKKENWDFSRLRHANRKSGQQSLEAGCHCLWQATTKLASVVQTEKQHIQTISDRLLNFLTVKR